MKKNTIQTAKGKKQKLNRTARLELQATDYKKEIERYILTSEPTP